MYLEVRDETRGFTRLMLAHKGKLTKADIELIQKATADWIADRFGLVEQHNPNYNVIERLEIRFVVKGAVDE